MTTKSHPVHWLEIDEYLEAFETAQRKGLEMDLREYLPYSQHPLHTAIPKELTRVDAGVSE